MNTGGIVMDMQNEDISVGIFIWPIISFFATALTAAGSWIIWG